MTEVKSQCDICKMEFTADSQAQANRTLGMHKRFTHDIAGIRSPNPLKNQNNRPTTTTVEKALGQTKLHWTQRPENKEKLRQNAMNRHKRDKEQSTDPKAVYQRSWYWRNKERQQKQQQSNEVVACQLSECPVCHSRFYVARGSQ